MWVGVLVPASFSGPAENCISILLCTEFGNNEGPDNSRLQFQLSLLQTVSRVYVLFSKNAPSHPPMLISSIPLKTGSGTDRPFQRGRGPSNGLHPPSPAALCSPPASVPLPTLFIICPHSNPTVPPKLLVHL